MIEDTYFYNLILEMMYCYFYHIWKEATQGCWNQELEIIGGYLGDWLPQVGIWSKKKNYELE